MKIEVSTGFNFLQAIRAAARARGDHSSADAMTITIDHYICATSHLDDKDFLPEGTISKILDYQKTGKLLPINWYRKG